MIFSKIALAAAAMMASSTSVVAKGTQPGSSNRCGTPHMTPEQVHNYNTLAVQSMNKLNALKANTQKTGGSSIQKVEIEDLQEKEIKVYVHVLANGTKAFNNPDGTGQDMFTLDGVVIRSDTLPFGTFAPFNLGRTATHEIGHWFGLDHPFGSGGCEGKGDMISDTPVEASPAYGCQVGRDSCPNQEGLDAVRNFMDYSEE
ncbi:hypothetical protein N0V85_004461 [Neurospora sp. IMI 360204]|nr:hypothetical protein N0V85_004461 [Neurospora sp. IMI 360204]